jgi:UDP-N-acetylmuramate--alanine ligase
MDCYRDMADIEQTFVDFMERVPFYGMVVACNDDERLRALLPRVTRRVVTYGTRNGSDFCISGVEAAEGPTRSRFRVSYAGRDLGEIRLHVPGRHNVLNATAAIAVGIGLDIPVPAIREALDAFRGVDRRFQLRGQAAGVSVIDDYGHHPTEIRATLAAARQCGFRRVHVIFQPHRYTRTQALLDEFATAFSDADSLTILDIYAASEAPIPGVNAQLLAARITAAGKAARYADSFDAAIALALNEATAGDMVLTLGAGNVSQLGPMLLEKLAARETAAAQAADHRSTR